MLDILNCCFVFVLFILVTCVFVFILTESPTNIVPSCASNFSSFVIHRLATRTVTQVRRRIAGGDNKSK